MPDLTTNETRQSYLPYTPPSGRYFGFVRSVERLKGDHNKSRYATDFRLPQAWRHQFKFLVTHDQNGHALPHIGIASFAEFLNSTKGNLLRLKAALHGVDLETAKRANLPHSNDLIAMPVWIEFERVEGVNANGRPFIQTNITNIGIPPQEWRDYLYSWLQQTGFEKKVFANSEDQYLSSPQAKRACELTDAELQQHGFQNFSVLGAIQQQRAAQQQQPQHAQAPPQNGFPSSNGAANGHAMHANGHNGASTYGQPPARQQPVAGAPSAQTPPAAHAQPPFQQPPQTQQQYAAPPQQTFAAPPASTPAAQPPFQQPPASTYAQPPTQQVVHQPPTGTPPAQPPFQQPPQFANGAVTGQVQHDGSGAGGINWSDVSEEIPM